MPFLDGPFEVPTPRTPPTGIYALDRAITVQEWDAHMAACEKALVEAEDASIVEACQF